MADRTIKRNNLTPALSIVARDAVGPADLEGVTAVFRMVNVLTGSTKINNGTATVASNVDFTASGATLAAPGHELNDGESVTLKTTGTLPPGLSTSREYFVVNATTGTLQLALTQGGSAIITTGSGSGTHSLICGRVSYDWQSGDTDTAGTFYGEIQTTLNSKPLTYPNTRSFLIEVISDLG